MTMPSDASGSTAMPSPSPSTDTELISDPPSVELPWAMSLSLARIVSTSLVVIAMLLTFGILAGDAGREVKGGLALALMLVLVLMRIPVGISMMLAGLLGIQGVAGAAAVTNTLQTILFRSVASWPLTVLPMFILMGILLWRSGATGRIYDAARVWTGRVPGGLAVTTNLAGAGLAAVSGSTLGITYALGRLGIPEMLRSGYDPRFAAGAVLMAGTGGQLMPPSILMVIYAGVVGTPVGQQLLAGVGPGILLPIGFGITIVLMATLRPELAPRGPRITLTMRERMSTTIGAWPIVAVIGIVFGGIFSGVFTATEAGAYGAALAVIITFLFAGPRDGARLFRSGLVETASATAGILLLIAGAGVITRMLTLSGLSRTLATYLEGLTLGRVQFLLLLVLMYLLLGMAIDPMTMVILTVPLLLPALQALDISLLWFGAFIVLLGELAIVTPPVGMLSFVVHKIISDPEVSEGRNVSLVDVFQSVLWFMPPAVIVLVLMIVFPEIVTWLPELSSAR